MKEQRIDERKEEVFYKNEEKAAKRKSQKHNFMLLVSKLECII